MELQYDSKVRGLLVEVEADELMKMAAKLCTETGKENFLTQPIKNISFTLPINKAQDKRRPILAIILTGIATILMSGLVAIGLYQVGKRIFELIY